MLLVIPAVGAVMFWVMAWVVVAVQPLAAVTVTRYVAGDVTDNDALVPTVVDPSDQEYVPPPVAVRLMDAVEHVSCVADGVLIPAVGAVISCVMVMLSVSVQLLAAVAVTVYVAGAVAEALALLPRPPDQV